MKMIRRTRRTRRTKRNPNNPNNPINPTKPSNPTNPTRKKMRGGRINPDAVATTEANAIATEVKSTETEAKTGETIDPEPIVMDVAAAAAEAAAEKSKKRARDDDKNEDENPELKKPNCSQDASLFDSVPKECINPGPQPQLHQLVAAAAEFPAKKFGQMVASGATEALLATGNEAIVDMALAEALGPEQAEQLKIMSDDPKVEAALGHVKDNISHAVENSINEISREVQKPVEDAATKLTTGVITAGTTTLASVTGPLMPLVTVAGTVGGLVNDATKISETVDKATGGVRNAMEQTTELTDALNVAQENAAAAASSVKVPEVPEVPSAAATSAAASGVASATSGVASGVASATSGVASGVSNATDAASSAATSGVASATDAASSAASSGVANATSATKGAVAGVNDANPNVEPEPEIGTKRGRGGGSRKRRRIAKLSRRIERTLRRVQNKYGLKDKNSFLRRTLNAKKMK